MRPSQKMHLDWGTLGNGFSGRNSFFVKEEAITEASKTIKQRDKREEFLNFFVNNNGLTREFKTQKFFDKATSNQILDKYSKLLQKTFYRCPLIPGVRSRSRSRSRSRKSRKFLGFPESEQESK